MESSVSFNQIELKPYPRERFGGTSSRPERDAVNIVPAFAGKATDAVASAMTARLRIILRII